MVVTASKAEFLAWQKKVIAQFPLESDDLAKYRYVEDKVVIVMFHPSEINATERTAPKLPSHLRLYHFDSGTLDGVSHGADKNEFRFAATDTGGLTNVSVPMNEGGIPRLLGVADPTTCSHASVYRTWLKHSGKKVCNQLQCRPLIESNLANRTLP